MPHRQLMEERLRFLNIDQNTISDLRIARDILEPAIDNMLDQFYSHLFTEPDLRELFVDQDVIDSARSAQRKHWMEALFSGKYDNAYFERTSQIGYAHARVGLSPNWYIGSYNQMLCQFIELITEKYTGKGKSATRLIQAVSKIIFLDMDLVMHCYLDAKDGTMRRVLEHATDFKADMWDYSDDLNTLSTQIKSTAETLSAEVSTASGKGEAISEQVNEITKQSEQLNARARQLDNYLKDTPINDKLYLPEPGVFTRLLTTLFGKTYHHKKALR